ncbi:hypothetical protein AB0N05_03775 [Nocardia sp. NPDC051030]|uniref:hypothetical protein n=1 Tax=Nocardia sp. NPDC051030 TaxID=3155162 RepID=UPI00341C2196
MASKRPVNRVTPQRRPAAQRASGSRRSAEDVRSDETATRATPRPGKTAQRGPSLAKKPAPQGKSAPARRVGLWQTWRTAILCGVAAVLLGLFALMAAFRPGVDVSNQAYVDNKATDEVKAAANHALSTLYGFQAKDVDKWKSEVGTVLTEQMRKDLEKNIQTTIDSIKQTQTDTKVTTDPVGVTLLTSDRAELLINLSVATVKDNKPEPLVSGPILLRMQKIDGRWLASEIADK